FSSRRRHTRFSRDWSSDVCSSDLDRDDVRLDLRPLVREQLSGTSHPALDLVEEEQQPELVADGADLAQIIRLQRADAAFALDRLDRKSGVEGSSADRGGRRVREKR